MKTYTYFLLLFSSLVFSFKGYGQSQITGKIQESDGKPLPFANVLLLNGRDSSLVKGAISDDLGAYSIDNIGSGTYRLVATMVGYKQAYTSPLVITDRQTEVKMPLLVLAYDTRQLAEVRVVTTRPFVEQRIDRTVVNVASSIIASGSTALEVLEKAPGVILDRQNDAISLRGKQGVIVQIDGKQTYLAVADAVALLRNTSSDNIDQIELITNPSSKYEAAGNAGIINIKMKKNNSIGTNGALSLAGGSGRFLRQQGSMQLYHRTEKLSLYGNYSANRGGNYWTWSMYRNQPDGEQRNVIDQNAYIRFHNRGQHLKAGLDYLLGRNTTVGLVWTGLWSDSQERGTAAAFFRREGTGPVYFQAQTDKTQGTALSNQLVNLNLQHAFGKKGGQLTADVNMGKFTRQFSNTLLTETLLPEEASQPFSGLFNQMPTTIAIRTVKADYTRILADRWKMEAGLRSSSVHSDNQMTLTSGPPEDMQPDPTLSNHFQYREQIQAAYLNFSGKAFAETELQVGLRAEQTHSAGNSITFNTKVVRRYLDLFPSLFISRPLAKNHTLTFSYSRRIDRPNYQQLNPSRTYVDPYAFGRGNSYLRPQYNQSLELKHGFKNKVFTSVNASYTHDFVFMLIQPVDNNKAEATPENIGRSQAYNLTATFPVTVMPGWNLQTSLLGVYSRFQYTYHEIPLRALQLSGRLSATNSLTLGKGWTAELAGWVNTPTVNVMWRSPWLGSVDAGLQKSIGSKLKAKLSVQDVLHTNKTIMILQVPDFSGNMRYAMDTRIAMLNLSYTFGNQQLKSIQSRNTGSEEERKRALGN